MKKKDYLSFCKIYFKGRLTDTDKALITGAYKIVKKFFKMQLPKFDLIFVNTRKEFDGLLGRKTPNYVVSFVNRKGIVIFSPETIEKETCWKRSDFYSTMVHEIGHLFFRNISKRNVPIWLNEGLAAYLQNNNKAPKNKTKISYLELTRKFSVKKTLNYNTYWKFVYFLLREYKKEKMIKLLKNIGKRGNNEKLFKKVYNKNLSDLVKDANNKF